ncbi:MAG: formate transporter FocA [Propionibacteriaceae bacterium]
MSDTAPLPPAQMVQTAIDTATAKATSPLAKSFLLAVTAGAFIAIGFAFYITSQIGAEKLPYGVAKVMGGLVFCTGLLLVVLTGAELFTSSTLSITAKIAGKLSWSQVLKNWGIVYLGNFIGALTMIAIFWFAGTWKNANGAWGAIVTKTANYKCGHSLVEAFFLGILCNILVCLGVWVTYAGRTVIDKIAAFILPITMFVATGFEHCVANMFLIPFGLLIKQAAPAAFWTHAEIDPATLSHLSWSDFLLGNLIPVTFGNLVGGAIFIGLLYCRIYHVTPHKENH